MKEANARFAIQILSLFYLFGMMVFIWQIDLSIGILTRRTGMLTNGWQTFDPMQIYHVSLFGTLVITMIYILIVICVFHKYTTSPPS